MLTHEPLGGESVGDVEGEVRAESLTLEGAKILVIADQVAVGIAREGLTRKPATIDSSTKSMTKMQAFRQGFVINTLNPKIALFFLSFLPQFIDQNKGSNAVQALMLGTLFVICGFITDGLYALTASSLREILVKGKTLPFVQRYIAGVVFIGLGLVASLAKVS